MEENIQFGVNNFRIFDKEHKFKFAPVTLLTGPNSSGKSSLIKSLLLLKDNMIKDSLGVQLNFSSGESNLQGVQNTLYNSTEDLEYSLYANSYDCKLEYKISYSPNLSPISSNGKWTSKREEMKIRPYSTLTLSKYTVLIDNKIVCNFSPNFKYIVDNVFLDCQFDFDFFCHFAIDNIIKDQKNRNSLIDKFNGTSNFKFDNFNLFEIKSVDEMLQGRVDQFLIGQYHDIEKDIRLNFNKYLEAHETIEIGKIFDDLHSDNDQYTKFNYIFQFDEYVNTISKLNESYVDNLFKFFENILTNKIEEELGAVTVCLSQFGEILKKFIFRHTNNIFSFSLEKLLGFTVVPAIRSDRSRFINIYDNKFFLNRVSKLFLENVVLDDYSYFQEKFLYKWLTKFEIGTSLKFDSFENEIYTLSVRDFDGSFKDISTLGYGVTQIVSLLLSPLLSQKTLSIDRDLSAENSSSKIITTDDISFLNLTVYLEEPEANLHPHWQSLLIELFVDINRLFDINFVIETHSEYMIRKLQNLVSLDNRISDSIQIIYFRGNKDYQEDSYLHKKKCYEIGIDENGLLTKSFGPGFLDEAGKLSLDLIGNNPLFKN